ncbi:MAG: hypothetical protein KC414_07175, partial [Romboutsia sp.]|nr:hypothetical protein [Romboutsia sp.]
MIFYGLKVKNKILQVNTVANFDTGIGNSGVTFNLKTYGDAIWLVKTREQAEYVATTKTDWFNADEYETPINDYTGQCEVV